MNTFYWHDYETWGISPRTDRAAQFAGMRTDLDFNPVGKPLVIYANPADDFLPNPGACMVTGLSPQEVSKHGIPEAEFFTLINKELSQSGTCTLGYNSIRFDDEFSRYGFYRNFIDPYAREWQNGNSRWDLIDLVRLMHALRPEGVNWPKNADGSTSFRLERLTAANNIQHEGAHDALSDVEATIELAKLIKEKQPKLFDYVFNNRDKNSLAKQLNLRECKPVVHISSRYPAKLGCIAVVVPVARDRKNKNGIIVYDLRVDPSVMIKMTAQEIHQRVFTATVDLPEGEHRIPLKMIHLNKSPVIAPVNTLTEQAREKWQLNLAGESKHRDIIQSAIGLSDKLQEVFSLSSFEKYTDPDQTLYDGFISAADKRMGEVIQNTSADMLSSIQTHFEDVKFNELFFRYKARNWSKLLSKEEKTRWDLYRKQRLFGEVSGGITLKDYRKELALLAVDTELTEEKRLLVNELLDWPEMIGLG